MTLSHMMETMDSNEFSLWEAEYQRMPWGEYRADLNAGQICKTIVNMSGKSLKDSAKQAQALDFMPYYQPKPEAAKDDLESIKAITGLS